MALRVAINGFGRIGRMVLRAASKDKQIEFVAINDLTDAATLAHLFKYDSVHGIFPGKVEHTADSLIINGKSIKIYAIKNPAELPWKKDKIDVVLKTLTYREREIIKLRYGLGDGYTYTLEEVGRIFKVTRERVRQIEAKAVRKLQHPLRSKQLKGFLDTLASAATVAAPAS